MGRASAGKKQGWVSDSVMLRSRYSLGVVAMTLELPFWPSAVALLAFIWVAVGPEGSGEPSKSNLHPVFSFTW